MLLQTTDITKITGEMIKGPVVVWMTPNGAQTVEHIAGVSPDNRLYVFWRSAEHKWQSVDVTEKTGVEIKNISASWLTSNGPYLVEHLAGITPNNELITFWWSPMHDWQSVNITEKTGEYINSRVSNWLEKNVHNSQTIEYLAGINPDNDLILFWWSPSNDWRADNISPMIATKFVEGVTSWTTTENNTFSKKIAGRTPNDDLVLISRAFPQNWKLENITGQTGIKISVPPVNWQLQSDAGLVECLASKDEQDHLIVFSREPQGEWKASNVSRFTGDYIKDGPSAYALEENNIQKSILGATSKTDDLLMSWWSSSLDWQSLNLSEATGLKVHYSPANWNLKSPTGIKECFAASDSNNHLHLIEIDGVPRLLTDELRRPFASLTTKRTSCKLLTVLWDYHWPDLPAPAKEKIESLLYDAHKSVRDYFLKNSNNHFEIVNAGVTGWYDSDFPPADYDGLDEGDKDGDGFNIRYHKKYPEAVKKAAAEVQFASYDVMPKDNRLAPQELGILLIVPGNTNFGSNQELNEKEYPIKVKLKIGGLTFTDIVEVYINDIDNRQHIIIALIAHELSHLFLGHGDMYFAGINNPFAAYSHALMESTVGLVHLDPFAKLKFGWLRPQIIFRSGQYSLDAVENSYRVWILMDLERKTDEYFIIENRWKGDKYESNIASKGGFAVWHIMENPAIYENVAPPPGVPQTAWAVVGKHEWARRAIRLIRPILGFDGALWDGSSPNTGYDLLSQDNDPTHGVLKWADGTPSGFSVRNISPAGFTMTAEITVPWDLSGCLSIIFPFLGK